MKGYLLSTRSKRILDGEKETHYFKWIFIEPIILPKPTTKVRLIHMCNMKEKWLLVDLLEKAEAANVLKTQITQLRKEQSRIKYDISSMFYGLLSSRL